MDFRQLKALLFKYGVVWLRNGFRVADFVFYPFIDLAVWGLVTLYILKISQAAPSAITCLICAIIFWTVQFRAQQVICLSFLDDIDSRNLLNMFIAPVRPGDYVIACYLVGFIQALFIFLMQLVIAYLAYSFNFSIMGLFTIVLFLNLLFTGWALGLCIAGLIIRFGQSAATLTWVIPFFLQPLSAVFYPVSILPQWLQPIALCLPPTHVFEGMRELMATGHMGWHHLQWAVLLNVIYMIIASIVFQYLYESAREHGSLTKYST